ncbi:4-hydroxy-tetrahydrodipicolinate synthase [bacterium]|nr:4-hydroxy-tetrahydrodipicolinate synthase [bacterium]
MSKIKNLQGCGTALVTPFKTNGDVDEDALKRLVDFQVEEGIDFLVPCGTTGESATLSLEEHLRVVEVVYKHTDGRVPVIAGAGGYNTAKVIDMAKYVADLGVDGLLSVTHYYNKPTQEGLFQHFKAIAEAVDVPIIMYNVPGRTSINLLPDTVIRLCHIQNIIGIKEASGNIGQIAELAVKVPNKFTIISGDDAISLAMIALGGKGVISVAANQVPKMMTELIHAGLDGDFERARKLQCKLFPLMKVNFIETNPIPVKASLAMMGMIEESYRLPLVKMKEEYRKELQHVLKELDLIK